MYTIELTLRYSPFPISIQKKVYENALNTFNNIKSKMYDISDNSMIELSCDKINNKSIAVVAREIIAIQIYEKSAIAGGSKRPGFSLDG
tara:strand:+ start:14605 stop:14871 length:267 start_codon:yes stop_codon:yes gene_type:complete